jgi:hypothetical protein
VAGRPRLQSKSVHSPQLTGVGDLVAHTYDDHAPGGVPRVVDAIDLERRPRRAQEGVEL